MWRKALFYVLISFLSFAVFTSSSWGKGVKVEKSDLITLFMSGDVMTGRGIDQILSHPGDPQIYEPYARDARTYVELAERKNGTIDKPVSWPYIWGVALNVLEGVKPDIRIINLETAVTKSDDYWKGKGINYRMHPENIPAIKAVQVDVAVLANNHVLDWGYSGLTETLETLMNANILHSGAGRNLKEAAAPAVKKVEGKGRVLVFSFGLSSSGIPYSWSAAKSRPGVNLLKDMSDKTVGQIKNEIEKVKQADDVVVASIHWGGNWGYDIAEDEREFAHKLIRDAGVDVIHGHSSHHVKGIEVYKEKLIIYGCGDLLTDYEGISGHEEFRDDLGLMYFAGIDPLTGKLVKLQMTPTQIKNFRLNHPSRADALWMRDALNREGEKFGTALELKDDDTLILKWE